ncbi:MAG: alpha/beta hydrolase [Gemmataceae bacterium]
MIGTTTRWSMLFFCACATLASAGAEEKKLPEQTAAATALVDALAKSDFTAAAKDFDRAMQKALPLDKRKELWEALLKQVGKFQKRTGTRVEKVDKYDVVIVTCQFEKMALDARVVFNAEKQVTGLSFRLAKGYDFTPPPYARPQSYRQEETIVGSGDWALPATLTLPKGEGPFAAVVLVHGSGPHDRDETIGPNKPFRDLAWGLASQGIAVLRYEKRELPQLSEVEPSVRGRRWQGEAGGVRQGRSCGARAGGRFGSVDQKAATLMLQG